MATIYTHITVHEKNCQTMERETCGCNWQFVEVNADYDPGEGTMRDRILRARTAARECAQAVAQMRRAAT